MRLSYNWLSEFIDIPWPAEELAEKLATSGTDIENIETIGADLDGVVVGQIKLIEQHPNADKLTVCRVDVGTEELEIVCGAKNMKVGDKVPVATVGTKLPGGMVIKKTMLRGVESSGMMCSKVELGLGEEASGLMILSDDVVPGTAFSELYGQADTIINCEITPNRPDCMSMVGMAREVAALCGNELRLPDFSPIGEAGMVDDIVTIEVEDTGLCPRYVAKVIEGVTIGPSPQWLQEKVMKAGFRPINNIVDVTNFITAELGQPLHAFDYDQIVERKIIVRKAHQHEMLETLDDTVRRLEEGMLLITDPSGPIALAGVMGGASSEVSNDTTTVLLESAFFNPVSISRTSRKLGLISEASMRFERGVDPGMCKKACERAMRLIKEVAGGTVLNGAVDACAHEICPKEVELRGSRLNAFLGTKMSDIEISDILQRLELETSVSESGNIAVRIPTFRFDLDREIDLIEEVARIFGYNEIVSTLPVSSANRGRRTNEQMLTKTIKETLAHMGLDEAVTYSFIDRKDVSATGITPGDLDESLISLENPISEDMAVLRPTLLIGLLRALSHNHSHDIFDAGLFELGRVFLPLEGHILPNEETRIGLILSGNKRTRSWATQPGPVDFYTAKGFVQTILEVSKTAIPVFEESNLCYMHPKRQAKVVLDNLDIGVFGELHPIVADEFGLSTPVVLLELSIDQIHKAKKIQPVFNAVTKLPGIAIDLAVLVDDSVLAQDMIDCIKSHGQELLKQVEVFDVYTGHQIEAGKKSIAFSMFLQAKDRTLTDEDSQKVRESVIEGLKARFGVTVR